MDEKALTELTQEIMAQGFDEDIAGHYAMLIGDTPIRGRDGKLVVRDGRRVVARLEWLKFFGESV
jgi:hypothetical protein